MYSLDNDCRFEGNIVKDPVIRDVGNTRVVSFTIAVNEYMGKDKEKEVAYVDCELWDSAADIVAEQAQKGTRIRIQATMRTDSWLDKETQKKRSKTIFRVNKFNLITRKKETVKVQDTEDHPF